MKADRPAGIFKSGFHMAEDETGGLDGCLDSQGRVSPGRRLIYWNGALDMGGGSHKEFGPVRKKGLY